jgi:hypothetical protein
MADVASPETAQDRRARGCWWYGCLTLGMMLLIGVLSIYFGGRYFYKTFVAEYTSQTGVVLPASNLSEAGWTNLEARLAAFESDIARTNALVPIELTGDEINALIERDPKYAMFKGHLHVSIDTNTAACQFSFLSERLGAQRVLHGRYLNGKAKLVPNLVNGKVYLTLLDAEINGKTVPDSVKPGLQANNLAEALNANSATGAMIRRFQSVGIQKGKLLIVAKGQGGKP